MDEGDYLHKPLAQGPFQKSCVGQQASDRTTACLQRLLEYMASAHAERAVKKSLSDEVVDFFASAMQVVDANINPEVPKIPVVKPRPLEKYDTSFSLGHWLAALKSAI